MITPTQQSIIAQYTITGVPNSLIKPLMKMLNLKVKDFNKFMRGQTVAVVGGESVYYPWDIERFVSGLPVID